jgi:type II secretory pathway pseudopilin PulG
MLVNARRARRVAPDTDDAGSAIVSVLIVMIVLSIFALAGAALVTNTTGSVVSARGSVQARAAADAGVTAALAEARRVGDFCSLSLASTNPNYTVTSSCASNHVTFVSTGRGASDGAGPQPSTTTQAVYAYTPARQPGTGADMIFFSSATFTAQVKTVASADPLTVLIPSGNVTCQVPMAASIRAQGDFLTKGSCDVAGSVTVGGNIDMSNGSDRVRGDLTASGTGTSTVRGSIGGNLTAGGGIAFGWERQSVGGDVHVAGDVSLGNQRLAKSLTLPVNKTLQQQEGVVSGSVARPATVVPPSAPTFHPWFDYAFAASDWPGYSIITLTAKGSGAGSCDSFNAHPATGWQTLTALTTTRARVRRSVLTAARTRPSRSRPTWSCWRRASI